MTFSQLKEIEAYISQSDRLHAEISEASVGWHLNHILIVITKITSLLESSKPEDYARKFNFNRAYVFILKKIPRGKAKAPKVVMPTEISTPEVIQSLLTDVKTRLHTIEVLPKKANFNHPYLGMLNRKQTLKFLRIHTEHHLKIVRDILAE